MSFSVKTNGMFNSQVWKLEKEVLELKIANTNLLYNKKVLNTLVTDVNYTGLTEVCKCEGCYLAKRFSELETDELISRLRKSRKYGPCLLRKCLCWQFDRLGLTFNVYDCEKCEDFDEDGDVCEVDEEDKTEDDSVNGDDDSDWSRIAAEMDSHIVFIDVGEGVWFLEYGKKIVRDSQPLELHPCLPKIKELFSLLEVGESFFDVEGKNYFTMADDGRI